MDFYARNFYLLRNGGDSSKACPGFRRSVTIRYLIFGPKPRLLSLVQRDRVERKR